MIHQIRHLDDPRVQAYARVGDGVWLKEQGLFVAEGRIVVRRLLESGRFSIHSIFATPAAQQALGDVLPADVDVHVADPAVLNAITGFNFHRGCLALARRAASAAVEDFQNARRLIAVEAVGNPDNVGGIFRVAAAFGVDGVIVDSGTADPLYRKAIRTSMGAALRVPFAPVGSLPQAVSDFQRLGFHVAALTPDSNALPLADFALVRHQRLLLVFGSEGSGLSDATLAASDDRVRIPIRGDVDSLNVVVAAGIALALLD